MTFPVYFYLGPLRLHPHFVMEALAYGLGLYFVLFRRLVRPAQSEAALTDSSSDVSSEILPSQRSSISVGALVGALLGAKLLVMMQHVNLLGEDWRMFALLVLQGKTIVGALLGGLIGVEVTKKKIGVRQSTGDSFVWSVMLGMMIGRVGCFLTGLSDRTYGIATTLPWGVDFGDGISRHPTQLYEVIFLAGLSFLLWLYAREKRQSGDLFKVFMIAYLGFRFGIDFIKPEFR
ncbi:MAG: prolipoprotein diacylglyceryl transferase family protein, partial [Cyanobacteria bacterium P01_D01_bin.36]